MGKKDKVTTSKWVTVPMSDELHGEVRSYAVRAHKPWPTVISEAMKLWVAVQAKSLA